MVTVGELISHLENYPSHWPVFFSTDGLHCESIEPSQCVVEKNWDYVFEEDIYYLVDKANPQYNREYSAVLL